MKIKITILALLLSSGAFAQWVNFIDETDTRIVVSNISDNVDNNAVDDQEKDFAVGDFDRDGFEDLVVVRKVPFSTPGKKTDLLFMNRNGMLLDETDIYVPEFLSGNTDARDVVVVDVNGDDWLDLFIVSTFQDQPRLFMNRGNDTNGDWLGYVDESTTRLPFLTLDLIQFCAGWSGDLTGNDAPDIYMVNYGEGNTAKDVLFINDGNGNFTDESEARLGDLRNSSFGTGAEIYDVDGDGDLDLLKNMGTNAIPPFNDLGTAALFNNGDGTFTNFQNFPGEATYMFTTGDLNDDGMLDFYLVDDFDDYTVKITSFVQDQSLTLQQEFIDSDRTDVWGGNVKMVDIDKDGDLDVTIASVDTDAPPCETANNDGGTGGARTFVLFQNEGVHSGNIVDPYDGQTNIWDISNYDHDFIDINNDGYMDIIMGTCDGYKIFVNDVEPLSIEDSPLSTSIIVSPNPSNGKFNLDLGTIATEITKIDLFDVQGRLVASLGSENFNVTNQVQALDFSAQARTGIYFLEITTDAGIASKKLIFE